MKIQCQLCKEIVELGAFVSSDRGIEIGCPVCAGKFFVASKSSEASASPQPAATKGEPTTPCPKCGESVSGSRAACKACGLLRERFDDFAAEAAEADEELVALWGACEGNWNEEDAHEAFVAKASATGAFAAAARRYRDRLRQYPGDPTATARLARLTKMAEVALLSVRPTNVEDEGMTGYRGVVALLVVLLLAAIAFGIYAVFREPSDSKSTRPVPASRR